MIMLNIDLDSDVFLLELRFKQLMGELGFLFADKNENPALQPRTFDVPVKELALCPFVQSTLPVLPIDVKFETNVYGIELVSLLCVFLA